MMTYVSKTFHISIDIQFIEVAYTQSKEVLANNFIVFVKSINMVSICKHSITFLS